MAFFGKKPQAAAPVYTAPPVEPPAPPVRPTVVTTRIAEGVTFVGDFKTDEEIRIEGAVKGDILSSDTITIREHGSYTGNAGMRNLEILGTAEGSMVCEESTQIRSGGKLTGALQTETLTTEEGSVFDGRLKLNNQKPAPKAKEEAAPAEAPAKEETNDDLPPWLASSLDKQEGEDTK